MRRASPARPARPAQRIAARAGAAYGRAVIKHPLLLALPLLASACASNGDFPSLAPRAVERLPLEEPVRVDPAVAPDPALRARMAALLAEARRGDGLFETALARALPRVRAAGPAQSDSWVQAQEAISRVEAARATTIAALADLDRLLVERAAIPTSREDQAALQAAHDAAEQLAADQHRRIQELRRSAG